MNEHRSHVVLTSPKSLQVWIGLTVLLVGLAVRLPHLVQSLWLDEMTTLTGYVLQPWSVVLAAGKGGYVPNNQVLHTILAKVVYQLGTNGGTNAIPPHEALLRLPALVAGILVPLSLAWPLRRSEPWIAFLVGLLAAVNPWLMAFSVEARGYSLLLLLGIMATNCLSLSSRRWKSRYACLMALAIYTIPLAVLLIPAHAVAMFLCHRTSFSKWLRAIGAAVVVAGLLYLPMTSGLVSYYQHPFLPTLSYREFLNALPRFAWSGSDSLTSAIYWAMPFVMIIAGSVLAWSLAALRVTLLTLGTATMLGVLLPLVLPAATEVRFVPWILLWFCLASVGLLLVIPGSKIRSLGTCLILLLAGWQVWMDVHQLPNQPIAQALQMADRIVPPGQDIMILYLGAREAQALYGDIKHTLLAAPDSASVALMQGRAQNQTGRRPWIVMSYEKLAFERNSGPLEARGLWSGLHRHYHLVQTLPGRVSPVSIYAPNEDG